MMPTQGEITVLLRALNNGDSRAGEQLFPLVYSELHRLAAAYMRRERRDHTLQPTALINQAYVRIAEHHGQIQWQNQAHFIGFAANVMRQVLVDHARQRNAQIRGGNRLRVDLEEAMWVSNDRSFEVIEVDQALNRLELEDPRKARVVELRYFGGLSMEETAALLGAPLRTVERDWQLAKKWLSDVLKSSPARD
jgi:RNA polymerase sigma-70 factor, ECF subfamily